MAQHGDLQVPIIDTRSDEQAEQAAQDAIQEECEHGGSLTGSQASRQRRPSMARSNLFTPQAPSETPDEEQLLSATASSATARRRRPRCSVGRAEGSTEG